MGFEESLVRDVMRRKIDQDRGGYHSAADLLDAVVEEQRWTQRCSKLLVVNVVLRNHRACCVCCWLELNYLFGQKLKVLGRGELKIKPRTAVFSDSRLQQSRWMAITSLQCAEIVSDPVLFWIDGLEYNQMRRDAFRSKARTCNQ